MYRKYGYFLDKEIWPGQKYVKTNFKTLSNKTNRVSHLTWTEKGQKDTTKTRLTTTRLTVRGSHSQDKERRDLPQQQQKKTSRTRLRTSQMLPVRNINHFQHTKLVLRRRPSFSSPVWKGSACVFRDRAPSLHHVVEFHSVINVNQHFVYVVKAQ